MWYLYGRIHSSPGQCVQQREGRCALRFVFADSTVLVMAPRRLLVRVTRGQPSTSSITRQLLSKIGSRRHPLQSLRRSSIYAVGWSAAREGSLRCGRRCMQVLSWLDQPAPLRPSVITLYFEEPDHAGTRLLWPVPSRHAVRHVPHC